jgi:hypothetical protein
MSQEKFYPPEAARNNAKRGLELRRKYGRGGLTNAEAGKQGIGSGVQRASNLANGSPLSYKTVKRMKAFFDRHEKNKDSRTDSGKPGNGMIAWLLWGGDAARRWANAIVNRMENVKKGETLWDDGEEDFGSLCDCDECLMNPYGDFDEGEDDFDEGEDDFDSEDETGDALLKAFPNQHAARQSEPKRGAKYRTIQLADGVSAILEIDGGSSRIQSVRADKKKMTVEQFKRFLMEHNMKADQVEPARDTEKGRVDEDGDGKTHPAKYFDGIEDKETRLKREQQMEARREAARDMGKGQYDALAGDKDVKTKPSKHTQSGIAGRIRDEMKGSGKNDFLNAASKVSGVAKDVLEEVYDRGLKAWSTGGHRPGATAQQWAIARVYSFLTPTGKTRTTADKDLWERHSKKR